MVSRPRRWHHRERCCTDRRRLAAAALATQHRTRQHPVPTPQRGQPIPGLSIDFSGATIIGGTKEQIAEQLARLVLKPLQEIAARSRNIPTEDTIAIDPTDPASLHAGIQRIADHFTALHMDVGMLSVAIGVLVSAGDAWAPGTAERDEGHSRSGHRTVRAAGAAIGAAAAHGTKPAARIAAAEGPEAAQDRTGREEGGVNRSSLSAIAQRTAVR
jgi:hypothetical protein